jgi:hypothetical protein
VLPDLYMGRNKKNYETPPESTNCKYFKNILYGHADVEPLEISIALLFLYWSVLLLLICKTKKLSRTCMSQKRNQLTSSYLSKPAKLNNIIAKSLMISKSLESLAKFYQCISRNRLFFLSCFRCNSFRSFQNRYYK